MWLSVITTHEEAGKISLRRPQLFMPRSPQGCDRSGTRKHVTRGREQRTGDVLLAIPTEAVPLNSRSPVRAAAQRRTTWLIKLKRSTKAPVCTGN